MIYNTVFLYILTFSLLLLLKPKNNLNQNPNPSLTIKPFSYYVPYEPVPKYSHSKPPTNSIHLP